MYLVLVVFSLVNSSPIPWETELDDALNQDLDTQVRKPSTRDVKDKIDKSGRLLQPLSVTDLIGGGLLADVDLLDEAVPKLDFSFEGEFIGNFTTPAWKEQEITPLFVEDLAVSSEIIPSDLPNVPANNSIKVNATEFVEQGNATIANKSATNERQDILNDNDVRDAAEEVDVANPVSTTTEATGANQEDASEESEEEGGDIVQSLISTFLSGLSTPEGGVDIDAIVGLIGGLSVLNDDGTYDFSGLTETLQSFLGGDAEGGGSDVGAFLGGLLGAVIQGVAKPPGAKGAGILSGNLITSILPGLSAPAPSPETPEAKPQEGPDSAGFFQGLFKSILRGSGGGNEKPQQNGWNKPIITIKQSLFKIVFSMISSILSSSSKSGWN